MCEEWREFREMCHRNRQFLQQPAINVHSLLEVQLSEKSNPPTAAHPFLDLKMETSYSGDPFHIVQSLVNPLGSQGPCGTQATFPISATTSTPNNNGKKRISQEDKTRIIHSWDSKVPKSEILNRFQIGESTFYRIIKDRTFPPQDGSSSLSFRTPEVKRRTIISHEEKTRIIQSWDNKVPRTDIMNQFHIGESTFYRILKGRESVLPAPSSYSTPTAEVKRRSVVSLEEKVRIIYNWENKVPKKEVLDQFQIGESTLYRILKDRGHVTEKYLHERCKTEQPSAGEEGARWPN